LSDLRRSDISAKALERHVKTMEDLARQHFPPAMFVVGVWECDGEHLGKDPADGFALIQKAAAKNHGPALSRLPFVRLKDAMCRKIRKRVWTRCAGHRF
jgi:hypothetical protein